VTRTRILLIVCGLLLLNYSVKSQGQGTTQIHVDTVKIVLDTIKRGEGLNGKFVGYRNYLVNKEIYQPKEGYNKIIRTDGKIYLEGEYVLIDSTYRRVGLFRFYNENGILDYTQDFNSSQRIYYFEKGEKKSEGRVNGSSERIGIWTCYYSTGVVKSQGEIKGTLKKGQWKYFDKKGKLDNKITYKGWTGFSGDKDCCDWE
jgi:antitoxin component YwqK of YwqJK toxin-antitoxin module